MAQNIPAACAHGEADADFARPFGHADEHDVHDADASDDKGDACKEADQDCHNPIVGVEEVARLLLSPNHKVVVLAFVDLVALAEEFGYLGLHVADGAGRFSLHEYRAELGVTREPFHNAGVGHQDNIILILPEAAGTLRFKPADNRERGALDADDLADGVHVFPK